jgi:hypothetical protein
MIGIGTPISQSKIPRPIIRFLKFLTKPLGAAETDPGLASLRVRAQLGRSRSALFAQMPGMSSDTLLVGSVYSVYSGDKDNSAAPSEADLTGFGKLDYRTNSGQTRI